MLPALLRRVTVSGDTIRIELSNRALLDGTTGSGMIDKIEPGEPATIEVPFQLRRRGVEIRLVLRAEGAEAPDDKLAALVARPDRIELAAEDGAVELECFTTVAVKGEVRIEREGHSGKLLGPERGWLSSPRYRGGFKAGRVARPLPIGVRAQPPGYIRAALTFAATSAGTQAHWGMGWTALAVAYDDGGLSGGTLDRPALQQLLAGIQGHKVDTVVVYKVDRLTRSLADFAKIVEVFDAHEVSFVSVTQQFNTTTSMGRLTLNMLLSFAQFERWFFGL